MIPRLEEPTNLAAKLRKETLEVCRQSEQYKKLMLDIDATVKEGHACLSKTYGIPSDEARAHVMVLIATLIDDGLRVEADMSDRNYIRLDIDWFMVRP